MGKKSKRNRPNKDSGETDRRQLIQARRAIRLEPRAEADQLREKVVSVMENHGSKAQCRAAMMEYVAFMIIQLNTDDYFATNEDVSFVKTIYRNPEKSPCLRAAAIFLGGSITNRYLWSQINQSRQMCVQLCNQVLASEIQDDKWITKMKNIAIDLLDAERGRVLAWTNPDGKEIHVGGYGRLNCDCCGVWVKDYGADFLQCCGRCKMAFYCSEECQKKDWKFGHKSLCRKRGEFHLGDTVYYHDPSGKMTSEIILHVLAPLKCINKKGKPQKYLVACRSRQVCIPVATKHLFRIRPVLWVETFWAPKAKAMELIKLRGCQN
jgi:MYND finger